MTYASSPVYLSSLLLEKNRWNGKGPALPVSEWIEPIAESGFNGCELWFNHLAFVSRSDWEAIKAEAALHQAEIPMLYGHLPTESTEKAKRQREALLDAVDFFRPKALRFHLGEPLTADGYLKKLAARVQAAAEIVRDIGRDTQLVFECQLYPFRVEEAKAVLEGVDSSRTTLAIRPFEMTRGDLEAAFGLGRDAVSHFGVRIKQGNDYVGLVSKADLCKQVLVQSRKLSFIGPWILETTAGVGGKSEDVVDLFDAAERDMNFLQELFLA
jgi:hypothetical protein